MDACRFLRIEPFHGPDQIENAFQETLGDVFETAEDFDDGTAACLTQASQQAAAFDELHQDEGDLQKVVIGLPLFGVGAVNVFQIQATVFLSVETFIF